MASASGVDRRYRITVYRPQGPAGQPPIVALDLSELDADQLAQVRPLVAGHLGPGFVAAVDGEVFARGPEADDSRTAAEPAPTPPIGDMLEHTRRLTELAVQQHEYCYAELQRFRRDYEEDFAQERAVLRTLRERWIARVCDDKAKGEDAVRYLVDVVTERVRQKDRADKSESSSS